MSSVGRTLERTHERAAPERLDDPLAFVRGLSLALGLTVLFWSGLAGLAFGVYELAVRV